MGRHGILTDYPGGFITIALTYLPKTKSYIHAIIQSAAILNI
jgi:hypothetical protein